MNQRRWVPSGNIKPVLVAAILATAGVALLIVLATTTPDSPEGFDPTQAPGVGRMLEGMQLEPLVATERAVTLAELRGKVTLINFWGPWCRYCHMEMPHLVELDRQLQDRPDFQLVSVSCSAGSERMDMTQLRRESADYLKRNRFDLTVHWDPGERTRQALATATAVPDYQMGYPTTLVLDRQGVIRGIWPGYAPTGAAEMERLINELLAREGG